MTILALLNWSTDCLKDHHIENPRLNAEMLLAHALNLTTEGLFVRLHGQIEKEEQEVFERLLKRRISGEPLQYLLGHQGFWSVDLKVDPRVLIPRHETEHLVEQALSILSGTPFKNTPVVLEIGTGSGAIAISLAKEIGNVSLVTIDISREALLLAKENAQSLDVLPKVQFVNGNLFDPFRLLKEKEPFDLILSNPPYIPFSEIEGLAKEVKDHEPLIAINGGEDGLTFHRAIISEAPFYLKKGGWLLLEVGQGQAGRVSELIDESGDFFRPQLSKDLSGIERVAKAERR